MGERMRPDYSTQAGDTYFVKRVGWRYEVWFSREEAERGEWRALHGLRFWRELSAHRVAQSLQIASNQAFWWRSRLEDVETEATAIAEASIGSMRHDVEDGGIVMVACGECQGIGCDFCDGFGHFNKRTREVSAEEPHCKHELEDAAQWRRANGLERYREAFYQIARLLGAPLPPSLTGEVLESHILPELERLLANDAAMSNVATLTKAGGEA